MGPVVSGLALVRAGVSCCWKDWGCEGSVVVVWVGRRMGVVVARRISFWVARRSSSRFRRSLSPNRSVEWASIDFSLSSRSLTWRSFRSRKARWLGGLVLARSFLRIVEGCWGVFVRCSVLCLPPTLGWCEIVLVIVTAACSLRLIEFHISKHIV